MNYMLIKKIVGFPGKPPTPYLTFFGSLLVLAIGGLDTVVTYDIPVTIFYVLLIILIAWYEGGVAATLISILSAVTWAVSDLASGHIYYHNSVAIWTVIVVLGVFLTVAYSITAIKKLLLKELEHAHIGDLTGVAKIRFFYERARIEISISALGKRPLALAYIDIDDLRYVNNTLGYIAGYYLLSEAEQVIKSTLRITAIPYKLDGSQYAFPMPETAKEVATVIIDKVHERFLDMAKKNVWPITFSTGAVTCEDPACKVDGVIKSADDATKAANQTGKNTVKNVKLE